jgi:BolA protein
MKVKKIIEETLEDAFQPEHFELINESDMHSGPPGRESHFKLTMVSKKFEGLNRVARGRLVFGSLGDLLKTKVHALALHLYTEEEWDKLEKSPDSPLCANAPKKHS